MGVRVQLEAVYGARVKICGALLVGSSARSSPKGGKSIRRIQESDVEPSVSLVKKFVVRKEAG